MGAGGLQSLLLLIKYGVRNLFEVIYRHEGGYTRLKVEQIRRMQVDVQSHIILLRNDAPLLWTDVI